MGVYRMTEKPPFRRCSAVIKDDIAYAESIRKRCKTEEEKQEFDEILDGLYNELGPDYSIWDDISPLYFVVWGVCVIGLILISCGVIK